jgi:hypothetical protein
MSPNINDITIPRQSEDKTTNSRAPWLIQLCELQGWTIVNGRQPGTPARHTFARGNVKSCIDLFLTNTSTSNVEYDPDTLSGLSDHTMITTKVHTAYFRRQQETQTKGSPQVRYKWVEGSNVKNYAHSAQVWLEFSQRPEFLSGLEEIVADNASSNDARAASVEKYILE